MSQHAQMLGLQGRAQIGGAPSMLTICGTAYSALRDLSSAAAAVYMPETLSEDALYYM